MVQIVLNIIQIVYDISHLFRSTTMTGRVEMVPQNGEMVARVPADWLQRSNRVQYGK